MPFGSAANCIISQYQNLDVRGHMSKLPIDDELVAASAEESTYLIRQQHPYAKLSVLLPGTKESASARERSVPRATATQKEFDGECRRIFGQYVPASEHIRVRP